MKKIIFLSKTKLLLFYFISIILNLYNMFNVKIKLCVLILNVSYKSVIWISKIIDRITCSFIKGGMKIKKIIFFIFQQKIFSTFDSSVCLFVSASVVVLCLSMQLMYVVNGCFRKLVSGKSMVFLRVKQKVPEA